MSYTLSGPFKLRLDRINLPSIDVDELRVLDTLRHPSRPSLDYNDQRTYSAIHKLEQKGYLTVSRDAEHEIVGLQTTLIGLNWVEPIR